MIAPTALNSVEYGGLLEETAKIDGKWIDFSFRRAPEPTSRHIVLAPGHSGIEPAYAGFRDSLANVCGADVITYSQQRLQPFPLDLDPRHALHPDLLNKQTILAAIDLLEVAFPQDMVELVGHSMGGTNSIDAGLRRVGRVGSITLVASAGLEPNQCLPKLWSRLPRLGMIEGRSILRTPEMRKPRMLGGVIVHNLVNPLRTCAETIEVAHRIIKPQELETLALGGTALFALLPEKDSFFPPDKQSETLKKYFKLWRIIKGMNHLVPQTHPVLTAEYVRDMLNSLDLAQAA